MDESYLKLVRLVKKIRRQVFLAVFLERSFLFSGVAVTLFFFLALLDYFFSLPLGFRKISLYVVSLLLGSGFAYLVWEKSHRFWSEVQVANLIQEKYPAVKDDFINALQLGRKEAPHFSLELVEALVTQVAEKVKDVQSFRVSPPLRLRKYVFFSFLSLFAFSSFYLGFPRVTQNSFSRFFLLESIPQIKVSPGDFKIARGSPLEILAEVSLPAPKLAREEALTLRYRLPGRNWERRPMVFLSENKYRFLFPALLENLEYRVHSGEVSSPLYSVGVIYPPEVGDLSFEYHYPAYTGLSPQTFAEKTNGDISALRGTKVTLTAKVNKPLKKAGLVFADGQVRELKIKEKTVGGEILVNKENTYWFEVEDEEGLTNPELPKYKIELKQDEFPKIEILSPEEDLIVSEKGSLKLTYEFVDDFGVKEVSLFYRPTLSREWRSFPVASFSLAIKEKIADWDWDLAKFRFSPGEVIEYYLETKDNDTISGPKKNGSKTLRITIFSYELEHENIEKELRAFRENLLEILATEIEAKKFAEEKVLEKISQLISREELAPLWEELLGLQEKVRQKTGQSIQNLKETLERMKNDPLATQRTCEEYSSLESNLEYLHSRPMQEVLESIKGQKTEETKAKQEEIVAGLEKMTLLSEDIMEYQRMYDLLTSAQELNEIGSKLTEDLQKLASLDQKAMQELNETLDKIGELFGKIQQLLQKMPEELPDEFINQSAVKEINLGETQNLADQLKQALARGDLAGALKYAQSLAQSLSKVLETLQQAAQSSAYSEMSKLGEELNRHSEELNELIEKEEKIINKTSEHEKKRLDKLLKMQEDLLKELVEKQRKVIEETNQLKTKPFFTWSLDGTIQKMEKVYTEFNEKKVYDSPKWLGEIIEELKNVKFFAENEIVFNRGKYNNWQKIREEKEKKGEKPAPEFLSEEEEYLKKGTGLDLIISNLTEIKEKEEEILEALKKGSKPDPSGIFSEKEKNEIQNIGSEQGGLAERTRNLNQKIQELGRKSALLGPQVTQNLRNAQGSMKSAQGELSQYSTGDALDKEKDALSWLSQSRDALSQAAQKLAGSEKRVTQPVAGFIQYPASGIYGVRIGPVKLPGADEYKPPKELRQEILQALKEKYPKLYEKLIKEYYKRLTE